VATVSFFECESVVWLGTGGSWLFNGRRRNPQERPDKLPDVTLQFGQPCDAFIGKNWMPNSSWRRPKGCGLHLLTI